MPMSSGANEGGPTLMTDSSHAVYPHLASPIRINGVEIPNRLVRSAHEAGFTAGQITDQYIAYHEARARGGVGLTVLEAAGVHQSSYSDLHAFLDSTMDGWSRLAERVHLHGMKVFQQLQHAGFNRPPMDGGASWSSSETPDPFMGRVAKAMTIGMIDEIVEAFAAAALRCQRAGIDGVELHGGHGYLIAQFLSPLVNRRGDEYGGSLENRVRFPERVLAAVRDAVGPEFPVGIRLSGSEEVPGGLGPDETALIARRLTQPGLADFVSLSAGNYYSVPVTLASMRMPSGYQLPTSGPVASAVTVPTIVVGRFTSLRQCEDVVASGTADLVSMVRATMADPEIVSKSFAGREDEVRPCIGCNQCIGQRMQGGQLGCAVNPEVGFELTWEAPRPVEAPRRIMVVGAGPAGLEAARTAALRGHEVVVHERGESAGGLTRISRRAPLRDNLGRICDWQVAELARLGVPIRYSSDVDAEVARRAGVDAIIIATGSWPRRDGFQRYRPALRVPGVDLPHVVTVADVDPSGPAPSRVLVFDDLGSYAAVGVAEMLLERGAAVTFATSQMTFAPNLVPTMERDPAATRLARHRGFEVVLGCTLDAIDEHIVTLGRLNEDRVTSVEADLVVLVTGFEPQRGLAEELLAAGFEVHTAGDCVVPTNIQYAVSTGHFAGMAV